MGKSLLFCEQKRSKKNFDFLGPCRLSRLGPVRVRRVGATKARSGAKVFLVLFFQKKNVVPASRKRWKPACAGMMGC